MQNLFHHRRGRKERNIGPQLPLSLWKYIGESIGRNPEWYVNLRLQQLMWQKRGHKLQYLGEDREYELWKIGDGRWGMELRRVKAWITGNGRGSPWQYKVAGEWKSVGVWFLQPGNYKEVDRYFWMMWRIAICSCVKKKFEIRDLLLGNHRWDLCKSCFQGEIIRSTPPRTLQRLVLLRLARGHVFQKMPLSRARQGTTLDFPWCRDTTGYLEEWPEADCWTTEFLPLQG
uniref:Virion infectivity factor n=1 Tax=Caprine arthritis encephalitis virus TaxID=11660 RepID=F6LY18_CAEV|nr:vif protein [Caprine arthritis encephalitis virus]